jgi:tetratricopeptide (TPR) repeat protein
MFKKGNFVYVFLVTLNLVGYGCTSSKRASSRYINNDSTAIFSTHPSRPFKYGYAYKTKEECNQQFGGVLTDFQLKSGDIVADVGAASGWVEGVLSVLIDSVTFYIEDVDTSYSNLSEFNKVINYYSKVRETPQTNSFYFFTGTLKNTNLPDNTFDKIILSNTFHEFSYKGTMLDDIRTKLKHNGKLIIQEGFSNKYKTKHLEGCNIKGYKVSYVIQYLKEHGFYLTNMTAPENSFWNCLTFEKEQSHSAEFDNKRNAVEIYIKELDKLNEKEIAMDSHDVGLIANLIKDQFKEISIVYTSLESYINSLGYEWLNCQQFQSAINVLKINVLLYPGSANVYDSLGDAYKKDKQYALAMLNYSKAIEINPHNVISKEKIMQLKKLLNDRN